MGGVVPDWFTDIELARHCGVPPDWFIQHHAIWRDWALAHLSVTREVERMQVEQSKANH